MRFGVLGPIEVTEKRRRLSTGGPKQRTVLALLIADAGNPVSTDALIQGVYGDDAPPGARRSVQTYVSNLRSELGDTIEASGNGYRLRAERSEIDAFEFDDLVSEASNGADPEARSALLREALALWRGHPYADVDGTFALTMEVSRLNERRAQAIEARVDADLDLGRHKDLIPELDSLTEEYPLRERLRAQQMLALYRSGRQAEALRAYERTRNYLVEEMGLDPSRELRDLEQRILEQDPSLTFETAPAVRHAAVLVADVADPRELSKLEPLDRDSLIQRQSDALDEATHAHNGDLFAHRGSAMYASFDSIEDAVAAAGASQQSSAESANPMRIGVSVGEVQIPSDGTVEGPPIARAAQLVAVAHGGQVLLSTEANQALVDSGEPGWIVRSLGQHDVDGSGKQRAVYQLVVDGLPRDFPPLRTEMLPPPLPIDVRGLPGYELREQVGSGAFGVVHRAYQPSVGREVAVKIIRPEYANDPDFIRHFEVEAQLVARLEHPHIVPLHDYWRSPEGAYIVMRWLRGGSLQERIADGPLSLSQADALVDQIAPALAFAHRHGVVHRDLKPSNILLDADGAPYLSDFGIARLEGTAGSGTVAGDVRDLAAIVALSLHGQTSNEHVAELLGEATTEDSPYSDVGSFVEAWTRAMGDQPAPNHVATYTPTRNPYKGLQAFGELDAEDFFGRDVEVAEIIDTLRDRRLVAVVGPSGIGKSSVTRAGAIPALREGAIDGSEDWLITDMLPGAYPFEELTAALMRVSVEPPREMEEELRNSDRGLVRYVRRYLPEGSTLLLVIDQFEELFTLSSDSERTEFLSMLAAASADERSRVRVIITMRADFFDRPLSFAELGDALREGTVPIASPKRDALVTMIEQPALAVGIAIESGLAGRITSEVRDQPGALPLLQYAMAEIFDARASDTITSSDYEAAGGVLGALGTRAETIYLDLDEEDREAARQVFLRLVRISDGGQVTRARVRRSDLETMNSVSSSLAVISAFGAGRLLTFDNDETTRMPTAEVAHEALLREWPRLASWIADVQEDLVLHARLTASLRDWEQSGWDDSYLLSAGRLSQHEAWTRTTDLDLSRAESEFLRVSRTTEEAKRSKRRRAARLVTAGFALAALIGLGLAVLALVARGDAEDQARLAEQKTAEAEVSAEEARRNANRADRNAEEATRNAALARARELAASAISVTATDPELATLLALEAFDQAPDDVGLFPEAMLALRQATDANRLVDYLPGTVAESVQFTPDGSSLLVVEPRERAVTRYSFRDGRIGEIEWRYQDTATVDSFFDVEIDPDGTVAAVLILNETFGGEPGPAVVVDANGQDDLPGRVVILDLESGRVVHTIEMVCREAFFPPTYFSGDGSIYAVPEIATDCADDPNWSGTTFYDTETWVAVRTFDGAYTSMNADATLILLDGQGPAELLTYPNMVPVATFDIYPGQSGRLLTPDGRTIMYRTDNSIDIRPGFWDVESNRQITWGDGFRGFYMYGSESFLENGYVLTPSTDSDHIYDPTSGRSILQLPTEVTLNTSVTADNRFAATSHADGVRIWEIGKRANSLSLESSSAEIVWLNPDMLEEGPHVGLWGFADGFDWRLAVLDKETGEVLGYRDVAAEGDQLPDGRFVFNSLLAGAGNRDDYVFGPLEIWDPRTGESMILQDCSAPVSEAEGEAQGLELNWRGYVCADGDVFFGFSAVASPDGAYVASVSADPATAPENVAEMNRTVLLRIWDASTGAVVATHELELDEGLGNRQLTHFGDGWIALIDGFPGSLRNSQFRIIDVSTGEVITSIVNEVPWRESMELSPDGSHAYFVTEEGVIVEYETASWQPTRSWSAVDGRPRGISVSPDGSLLAIGGEDERLSVWSVSTATSEPVLLDRIPLGAWASDSVWVSDTTIGVVALKPYAGIEWRTIELDPDLVVDAARAGALRTFTRDECILYGIESCVDR